MSLKLPNSAGIGPESLFLLKYLSRTHTQYELIIPVVATSNKLKTSQINSAYNVMRCSRSPIEFGIDPVKTLSDKSLEKISKFHTYPI